MSYLAPIHHPSNVKHAVKLHLVDADEYCLVLAKAHRLELLREKDGAYVVFHSQTILGKVTMLDSIRVTESSTDHLLVGTDENMYFTVSWDPKEERLRTETNYIDQADKTARDSQTQDRCIKDPTNQFIALFLYEGVVNIVPLSSKSGGKSAQPIVQGFGEPIPTRISDLFVRSAIFLSSQTGDKWQHQIALLHANSEQNVCLTVRALDYVPGVNEEAGTADLEDVVVGSLDDIEPGSSHLVPIRCCPYGFLVLAETNISYYSTVTTEPLVQSLEQPAQFVTWTAIDDLRWLLADDYGRLYLLMLSVNSNHVEGWKLDLLGSTSRASTLVYLDDGLTFVGSHQGDSQIVRIREGGLDIIQVFANIAPILDFTIMDLGSLSIESKGNAYASGQSRIVTGSGAFQDGSLRSVRSGLGMEEHGMLEAMDNAIAVFAFSSGFANKFDDLLLVSFVEKSRIFWFGDSGEIEEQADFKGIDLSASTLLVTWTSHGHLLQVTSRQVRLLDVSTSVVLGSWSDEDQDSIITAVSFVDESLLLSRAGREVVSLTVSHDVQVRARKRYDNGLISCIHIPAVQPDICFLGFWHGGTIAIAKLDSLNIVRTEAINADQDAVPRSLLLVNLFGEAPQHSPTLLVSLASGEVVTAAFKLDDMTLSAKQTTTLGTDPADLVAFKGSHGCTSVFALCEHSTIILGVEGRVVYYAITAENASSVCPFNSVMFPGAMAIATCSGIRIASIDTERSTHLQTVHFGELVRRVAYSPSLKAFGLGTIRRSLRGSEEIVESHFKLVDETSFQELDSYKLDEEEIVESVIRAELWDVSDDTMNECFVVGTTDVKGGKDGMVHGKILVFMVKGDRTLELDIEYGLKCACRALGNLDGKIVAGLMKTVVVYALAGWDLRQLCSFETATAPIDLAVHAPTSQIAVADLMKSISILTLKNSKSLNLSKTSIKYLANHDYCLEETGRHMQTSWSTAVARVGDDVWLQSDAEGNLIVLHQDVDANVEAHRRRLNIVCEMRLGEMVNRIRPMNVVSQPHEPVIPRALIATVEGGVYLFGTIAPAYLNVLLGLQTALAPRVASLGGLPYNQYRAFKTQVRVEEESRRFVDAELVEGFLTLPTDVQRLVVSELDDAAESHGGVEGICCLVESLKSLR